jgi:hypothetical protein
LLGLKIAAMDASNRDNFNVHCNLSLRVEKGGIVYPTKEVEVIKTGSTLADSVDGIVIPLEDLPLGWLDQSVADKIAELMEEVEDKQGYIEGLESWNRFFGIICGIVHLAALVDSLVTGVILGLQSLTCVFTPAAAAWTAPCTFLEKFHGFIIKWIWDYGDWYYPGLPWKIICLLYWGTICDEEFWAQFIGGVLGNWATTSLADPALFDDADSRNSFTQGVEDQGQRDFADQVDIAEHWNLDWDDYFANYPRINPGPPENRIRGNPYKSIYNARGCWFYPGIIYNEKKLQQILCRQIKCYEVAGATGIPTTACDVMFNQMECLYYDGAEHLMTEDTVGLFDGLNFLLNVLFAFLGTLVGADALELLSLLSLIGGEESFWEAVSPWDFFPNILGAACFVYRKLKSNAPAISDCASACAASWWALCELDYGIKQVDVVIGLFNTETLDKLTLYDVELEGTDYCEGII